LSRISAATMTMSRINSAYPLPPAPTSGQPERDIYELIAPR
jgi:hypothetical protein